MPNRQTALVGLIAATTLLVPACRRTNLASVRARAEQGNPDAQYRLASLYETGDGVPQDLAESARWYRRCADQGSATGQRNVGFAYVRGDVVQRDLAEAARWFRKAADQGDRLSQAYLASAYRTGRGVPRDRLRAAAWYLRFAASCLHRAGWTSAVVCLVGLGILVVPERRWGRRRWLFWAISATACSVYAVHLLSVHPWTGWWNQLETAVFVVLAAVSVSGAVYEALQNRRSGSASPVA